MDRRQEINKKSNPGIGNGRLSELNRKPNRTEQFSSKNKPNRTELKKKMFRPAKTEPNRTEKILDLPKPNRTEPNLKIANRPFPTLAI